MRIFKLDVPDRTTLLVGDDNHSLESLSDAGKGSVRDWGEVNATIDEVYMDSTLGRPDVPWLNDGTIVLPNSDSSLAKFLSKYGELFPVAVGDGQMWVFSATTILSDALGPESVVDFLPGTHKVLDIQKWSFRESRVRGFEVFRVQEMPLYVLFGETAAEQLSLSGLRGPELREVWRSSDLPGT